MHFLFGIGGLEIFLIILAVLLLFGAKRLPDFMRTFGKGMREFKKATEEIKQEISDQSVEIKKDIEDFKENITKNDDK